MRQESYDAHRTAYGAAPKNRPSGPKEKTMRATTKNAKRFPSKVESRNADAQTNDIAADAEAPELARTYTASEAQAVISMSLKPMDVRWMETTIFGEDLITHRWSEKARKEMLANQQRTKEEKKLAKMNREKKDPKADFEGARYHWDDKDWFPANGIKKAMVSAGFALGIPRSVVQRCVFVVGAERRDYVEIRYSRIVMREDAVKVGPYNKRETDLRYRPEYQNWSARLRIRYRADVITAEQVLLLLRDAGFSIGIGEWRPERGGQAGTFEVESAAEKSTRPVRRREVKRAA